VHVLGALALSLSATVVGAQAPAAANRVAANAQAAGNPDTGKTLFMAHQCFACHGYNGETSTRLLQEDGTFSPRLQTVDRFIAFIRAPRPGQAPPIGSSVSMPSYGVSSLPDERAADLFAYIRTFKPTEPPLKDIPLLDRMIKEGGKLKR
jgi:mono/diheme cytochrome c family protein